MESLVFLRLQQISQGGQCVKFKEFDYFEFEPDYLRGEDLDKWDNDPRLEWFVVRTRTYVAEVDAAFDSIPGKLNELKRSLTVTDRSIPDDSSPAWHRSWAEADR